MQETRQNKIARLLQKELAEIFQSQTRSMHGVMVSVTRTKVSPDLSVCTAYLSIFPSERGEELIKNVNTNLRYKLGKTLSYNPKEVYEIKDPHRVGLPAPNISTTYIFATEQDFFAYPNNYNYYVSYYKDTFQHGGISLEEMLIPLITMKSKGKNGFSAYG